MNSTDSEQEAQPSTAQDQPVTEVPAASAAPQGDVAHEEEKTEPVEVCC